MTSHKDIILNVEVGENGLPFIEPVNGAQLNYSVSNSGNLNVDGNKEGLLLLAKALVGLAYCERGDGYHIHLDDLYRLNEVDNFITITKEIKSP